MHIHSLQMCSGKTHPCTNTLVDTDKHTAVHPGAPTHVPSLTLLHIHTRVLILLPSPSPLSCFSGLTLGISPPCYPTVWAIWRLCLEWRGREILEKGRSEDREVGQRPWQFQGFPGHWLALGINPDAIWPPPQAQSPAILGPFVSSCFLHQVSFSLPCSPCPHLLLLGCLHWPLPSSGLSLQCSQGASSSLLGTLTLRSSADTKLSEASNCSLPCSTSPPCSASPPIPHST